MSLGENIFRLRSERNMSQGDLADVLGVSRQSVSKWENGNAIPDLDKQIKMSELFDISLDSLVKESPSEPSIPVQNIPEDSQAKSSTQKTAGIILLCFGILLFLMIFWATSFSAIVRCLLFSVPLILCGAICLRKKQHAWLLCLLVIYGYLWLPMGVFSPNYINYNGARTLQLLHLFWGLWLLYGGRIWKKHNKFFTRKKDVTIYYVFLGLTSLITLLFFLFPNLLPAPGLLRS